jgi:hypothetical protein
MTGPEALQALREGKKIKRVHWDEGAYIYAVCFKPNSCYLHGCGQFNPDEVDQEAILNAYAKNIVLTELLMEDDWEVLK